MKSEVELWQACLIEAGEQYSVRIHRDMAYAMKRIEDEGIAFLTITLPRFEKDLLSAISSGRVSSNHFVGFRRRGGLPAFLSGFLRTIFDEKGALRSEFDSRLLRAVRQVLLLLSKLEMPVSRSREVRAIQAYIQTDEQLVELSDRLSNIFRSTSRVLLGDFLAEVEYRIWSRSWTPRHSTGALATGETANGRYSNATWTERLHEVLPWWDDLTTFPSEIEFSEVTVLARDEEPSAKMVLVPKTMKGPRVIVEEPCHMQYVQQGIFHVMSEVLREKRFKHLHDAFSWDDQIPNRSLARFGSIDGSYATIDLSEASDRVSLAIVDCLLSSTPYLRSVINASRSESVRLPNGKRHAIHKFASMGSSLCFPIESMVFYIIAKIAQAEAYSVAPSVLRSSLKYGEVRVYGDDIVVPQTVAQGTLKWLEAYGLKVNVDKTFTTGHFRESCGSDWFRGEDVSVFKIRAPFPKSAKQHELLRRAIDFHNRAYGSGWFLVAATAESLLKRHLPSVLRAPVGTRASVFWSWEGPHVVRTSRTLFRPEYKCYVFREVKPRDELEGYGALKKSLPLMGDQPLAEDHLVRAGRSRCVGMNIGWTVGAV